MMKPDNPVEPFKRAVTAAVRAIARDSELTVNFGAEGTATGAGHNRLPTPSRELGAEEVAHVRGSGDALALWHRHHDNRLHALADLYSRVRDRDNWHRVYDLLTFSNDRRQLRRRCGY